MRNCVRTMKARMADSTRNATTKNIDSFYLLVAMFLSLCN